MKTHIAVETGLLIGWCAVTRWIIIIGEIPPDDKYAIMGGRKNDAGKIKDTFYSSGTET